MALKFFIFLLISAFATSSCLGGVISAVPAAYALPYASSYNAHVINHAVAAPYAAAPVIAASAPIALAPHPHIAYNALHGK